MWSSTTGQVDCGTKRWTQAGRATGSAQGAWLHSRRGFQILEIEHACFVICRIVAGRRKGRNAIASQTSCFHTTNIQCRAHIPIQSPTRTYSRCTISSRTLRGASLSRRSPCRLDQKMGNEFKNLAARQQTGSRMHLGQAPLRLSPWMRPVSTISSRQSTLEDECT